MKDLQIILFSESRQFLDVTKRSLETYNLNILECINDLDKIKKYTNDKTKIFIVQVPNNDKEKTKYIINFFAQANIYWICVTEDRNINFLAMTKGATSNVILKQTPTSIEYKLFIKNLINKITECLKICNIIINRTQKTRMDKPFKKIIAIGASTGGTEAIQSILTTLTEDIPPIVIVIHMPEGFTKMYANRLNELCKMYVKEAEDGDILKYGVAYIAPGGYQMRVIKKNKGLCISCLKEQKINGHMPSVDVLFESVAESVGKDVVCAILTGMGNDGALGMLSIKNKGGFTIGQSKKDCVVYGMPKSANEIGAVIEEVPLGNIPKIIMDNI